MGASYHGMLDVEVDAGLLWVNADFDRIIHRATSRSEPQKQGNKQQIPLDGDENVQQTDR
jgi:hypothetical protein